jgi:hypothetical protein
MNRINPLYILALLVVVVFVLTYKIDEAKSEFRDNLLSLKESEDVAVKLSSLKTTYSDKTKTKQSLEKILRLPSIKALELDANFKKTSLKIHAKSIDKKGLNLLVSKLVNGSFIIDSMKVRRASESSAELSMEIKW